MLSVNKLDALDEAAGMNLYPIGKDFSGNYALRFDMYLMQVPIPPRTTEHVLFGINHSGTRTNWFSQNTPGVPADWEFDGIWAGVVADGSGLIDYGMFSAPRAAAIPGPTVLAQRSASTLTNVFHQPPWTSENAGSPANINTSLTPSWAQVELRQVNGVVTMSINQTNILTYTNTTEFTRGNIMLGYDDSFNTKGDGGYVFVDNVRVVRLEGGTTPTDVRISTITRTGNNIEINFTAGAGEPITAFDLYSAPTVHGPWNEDTTATITQFGSDYRVTTTATDTMRFYRIRRATP
jgi:hypothetical protein